MPVSYQIPDTWSLEATVDYLWAVQAALEADPALISLSATWVAFEERVAAERQTRDAARKGLIKAASLQRRADLVWDKTVKRIGTRSFSDAERDAKKAPYALLFGGLRPSDATRLGAVKASELGGGLVLKLRALGQPDYDAFADALGAASEALGAADRARKTRAAEAQTHDIRRRALLEDLEGLIDRTQIDILRAYPGDSELVRAVLSPWKDATRVNREEGGDPASPAPDPLAP